MCKRLGCFILLSALILNISMLKDIKKINNGGPWDDVIQLTTIKSDTSVHKEII